MKSFVLAFAALFSFLTIAYAQPTPEQKAKSDQVMQKLRQIDILTQIVPLVLTKDQLNALLPVVEKARAAVYKTEKDEAEALAKLDSKVTSAVDTSVDKGVPPSKELLDELADLTFKWSLNRSAVSTANTDLVLKKFKEVTNVGQQKAAINSLAPQLIDPSLDPKKMSDEDKLRFFIQQIFLDPQCYPILIRLAAKAK